MLKRTNIAYQSVMGLTNDSCAFLNEADLHVDAMHSHFSALSALP